MRRSVLVVMGALALVGIVVAVATPSRAPRRAVTHTAERPAGEHEAEDSPGAVSKLHYGAEAFPRPVVTRADVLGALRAAQALPDHLTAADFRGGARQARIATAGTGTWKAMGPFGGLLSRRTQFLQNELPVTSGRVTSIVISPDCRPARCRVWIGTAGGGVWRTDDGLGRTPGWRALDNGIYGQAIGSLALDPSDPSHNTIYAGTGEGNYSFSSEAGYGLFKSTDGGDTWSLVPGSLAPGANRSIRALAIDPEDPNVIWIGTSVGERGAKDAADLEAPGGARMGVYRSTDGGGSFALEKAFRAGTGTGVIDLAIDPARHTTVYASTFDRGVWRTAPSVDSNGWHRLVRTTSRSQVAVASHRRVWITDGAGPESNGGSVLRIDRADLPFRKVTAHRVSSQANGAAGFCHDQCYYDQALLVDPDHPGTAWIGGSYDYRESGTTGDSNGRAVLRTRNGGRTWNDMTTTTAAVARGTHPDIHAIALAPAAHGTAFIGSDGGLVRTSGRYANGIRQGTASGKPCRSTRCRHLLSSIPTGYVDLNEGLSTLQFLKVGAASDGSGDFMVGAQDNGTWQYRAADYDLSGQGWLETFGGDGAGSVIDARDPAYRVTSLFNANPLLSTRAGEAHSWKDVTKNLAQGEDPFQVMPLIGDPVVSRRLFAGARSIWRATDVAGHGWSRIDIGDQGTVSALARTPSDTGTVWAGTGTGTLLVSHSADAARAGDVRFAYQNGGPLPQRFVSAVAVDPADSNHAWVAFSGYGAATPDVQGHVYSVHFADPAVFTVTDVSSGLGDQPVDDLAYDAVTGDLYAGTDFGVARLPRGATKWENAAAGLPQVVVTGLTIPARGRVLYAATHGRGVYALPLP